MREIGGRLGPGKFLLPELWYKPSAYSRTKDERPLLASLREEKLMNSDGSLPQVNKAVAEWFTTGQLPDLLKNNWFEGWIFGFY